MDKDSESLIREWLAEYKSLPESSIPNYAESVLEREDVLDALMKLFKSSVNQEHPDHLMQSVCHQLFEFYRSGFLELKRFTINLLPSITLLYIVSASDDSTSTDTLLLSIYALSSTSSSLDFEMEIPQLGYSSIYHDPMSGIFSEQMVDIQNPERRFYQKPILPNHQIIIPSNRFQILTRVLGVYFEHIGIMKKKSHLNICESCQFLASSGYPWKDKYLENSVKVPNRRYNLSVDFMLRMLRCLYFTMYNYCWSESLKAVEAMQRRARKEMIPQVLFLCNVILNSATEPNAGAEISEKTTPYGLTSASLTPILTRESSRKGGRYAATSKSIKDHKWRHRNEEISGDLTGSLINPEMQPHPPKLGQERDNSVKTEKHSLASPGKLLKSKLKKSVTIGSPGLSEKSKAPVPSSGDKRSKKHSMDKTGEEIELEKIKRSPTQRKESSSKNPSKSIQKHPSMEDTSLAPKLKGVSISKSASDIVKSSVQGKLQHQSSSAGDDNDHSAPLLDRLKPEQSISSDSRSKESPPLLKNSDSSSGIKNSSQQTAF